MRRRPATCGTLNSPRPQARQATVPEQLDRYRELRRFGNTPEPAGATAPVAPPKLPRFVIQQHSATRLHWDLRLERDGVLASFACPRGLPWSPGDNRLAVHTEDHPLEYLDFHGEIPAGNYGAGTMTIWDRGTYEAQEFTDTKITVTLHGGRIEGTYALFPLARRGETNRDWMIHRVDPPQDPGRRPLPDDLRPMLAVPGDLPEDPEAWAFEIRWPGLRTLITNDAGRITVAGADGTDVTRILPELRPLGRELGAVEIVVDAVVVAIDDRRRPAPAHDRLQRRGAAGSDSRLRRLAKDRPVAAMVFDLLWLEGRPAYPLAYDDRRRLLGQLGLQGPAWQVPTAHHGDGAPLLAAARAQGTAGLVAKRRASPYRPGARSSDWLVIEA